MTRLMLLMLVALQVTLLTLQLQAQDLTRLTESRTYNSDQLRNISEKLVAGDKCEADLELTTGALNSCNQDVVNLQPSFWQKPEFEIAGAVVILNVGFALCAFHMFGLCK